MEFSEEGVEWGRGLNGNPRAQGESMGTIGVLFEAKVVRRRLQQWGQETRGAYGNADHLAELNWQAGL